MKTRSYKIAVALAAALVSTGSAVAEDMNLHVNMDMGPDSGTAGSTNGIYLSGDAGLSIMQNMTSQGNVIQYHVGPRIDVIGGYNLTQNIAVELQGGFTYNSWSAVNGVSIGAGNSVGVWAVPVMANGVYKYWFNDRWQAYGGLGVGVLVSTLDLSEPGGPFNFTSTDYEFGYQAMVGIRCLIDDHWEWGLGYKFLGSLDHHWNGQGMGLTTSPTYMHSILVTLTCKF
jgi:opacity protein-like surface antigen